MRGYKLLAGLALALIPVAGLFGQITVKVQTPPSNQIGFDDLWSVEIKNSSDRTFTVSLRTAVSAITPENRVDPIARANSNSFQLPSGTKKLTRSDVTEIKDAWFKPGYEDLLKSGGLPTGTYQIEATIVSSNGDELGWDHAACKVAPPAPPRLTSPTDGTVLTTAEPTFDWRAPAPLAPDAQVLYHFRIVVLQPGQGPEEALKNPAWFEDPNVSATTLVYPPEAKPFVKGSHYYWQVKATVANGDLGTSETWSFSASAAVAEVDLGRGDLVAALDLTMTNKVKQELQNCLIKFDNAKDALDRKDMKSALKSMNEVLRTVNDLLNKAGKTKETTEFIDKLRSARRKLEAEIEAAKVK